MLYKNFKKGSVFRQLHNVMSKQHDFEHYV